MSLRAMSNFRHLSLTARFALVKRIDRGPWTRGRILTSYPDLRSDRADLTPTTRLNERRLVVATANTAAPNREARKRNVHFSRSIDEPNHPTPF